MHKTAEYAPGIPSKKTSHELPEIKSPTIFEFGVHDHHAEKRGRHFDLRLGDPKSGHAHSWAMHAKWPAPGEKTWAIQQPTHTMKYMDFEGTISDGYGKGDVYLHKRDKTEIINSKPGHISFNVYTNSGPEEYTLHRMVDNKWILMNRTLTRQSHPKLPDSKPKYKEKSISNLPLHDDKYVMSAKIDDAHNLFYFPASGERVRVMSYRPGKKSIGGIIEHTHKVPGIKEGLIVPKDLGGTIVRGGLYAMNPKTKRYTPANILAGMLNSNVWKSREAQKQHGELIPVLYDVVQYKGRNIENAPYEKKLEVLNKIVETFPDTFELPRMAFDQKSKQKLIHDMSTGNIPETEEGVVLWNLKSLEAPIKAKFRSDHDVYIRDFFPGEGKYKNKGVGGFLFSHEPDGPIVGKVGTGLSDEQRIDMFKHPQRYKGMVARVKAQEKYRTGALRGPSLTDFHLDKNTPDRLALVKMATSEGKELMFIWGRAID